MTPKQITVARALAAGHRTPAAIHRAVNMPSRSILMVLVHMRTAGFVESESEYEFDLTDLGRAELAKIDGPPQASPTRNTPRNQTPTPPTRKQPMSLSEYANNNPARVGCLAVIAAFLLIGGIVACDAVEVIEPGEVGVKTSWGTLDQKVYSNDWYWIWPWENLTRVNVQEFSLNVTVQANQADAAVTRDKQSLGYALHVSCQYNPAQTWLLFEHFGRDPAAWPQHIVAPLLPHGFKTVSSQRTLDQAISERTQLSSDTASMLSSLLEDKLTAKDNRLSGAIRINQVTIPNLDYSNEYQQVIEQTQRVQEEIREQRNQLVRYMVEQARSVVQAEAQQQADIARATGAALANIIQFEAELTRMANLVRLGVDPNQIYTWDRLAEIAAHWNGELPRFMNGDGGLPLRIPLDAATGEGGREITEENIELMLEGVRARRSELEATLRQLRDDQRQLREDLMHATERPSDAVDELLPPGLGETPPDGGSQQGTDDQ